MHQMLKEHPDVFVAESDEKDTRFFSYFFDHGYQWYEKFFQSLGNESVCGEISTSYFYDLDAPKRLYEYNPRAKIIVSFRNPVERIISNHRHEIKLGHIQGSPSLEDGLVNNPAYVDQSKYYTHIKRWMEYFPRDQFLILLFDDLQNDAAGFAREIYQFVGVDDDFVPPSLDSKANEGLVPKSRFLYEVLPIVSKVLRQVGLGSLVEWLKSRGVKKRISTMNNRSAEQDVLAVSPETEEKLRSILHEEVESLSGLLDRDLSFWN